MALDDRQLAVPEHRADVDLFSCSVSELADHVFHPLLELVCHAFDYVNPLYAHTNMAGIQHRVEDCAACCPLEIGVFTHNHRVFSTELQRVRDQLLGACRRDLLSGSHAPGERDLLYTAIDQRRTGFAIAMERLHDAFRHAGFRQQPNRPVARVGGHLGRFQDDRVARQDRLHGRVHRQRERTVPRRDDADHAERSVVHHQFLIGAEVPMELPLLVRELLDRAATPEVDVVAPRKDFHDQRLEVCLARLADDRFRDLIALFDENVDRAANDSRAFGDRQARPFLLCITSLGNGACDIRLAVDDDLADRFAGSRTPDPEPAAPLGGWGKWFDDGHPFAPVVVMPREF